MLSGLALRIRCPHPAVSWFMSRVLRSLTLAAALSLKPARHSVARPCCPPGCHSSLPIKPMSCHQRLYRRSPLCCSSRCCLCFWLHLHLKMLRVIVNGCCSPTLLNELFAQLFIFHAVSLHLTGENPCHFSLFTRCLPPVFEVARSLDLASSHMLIMRHRNMKSSVK